MLAEFDFDGYAMAFYPGVYSLYADIIDPDEDDVLAVGFPDDVGDQQDPNPVSLDGAGPLLMNFILFDADEELLDDEDWDDEDDW